jgi:hypothetical protein
MKRIMAGAVLWGTVGVAGWGFGVGLAHADPGTVCNQLAVCSRVWCPGNPLPAPDVRWDMNRCHHYYGGTVGERGTVGGVQVGTGIIEGDPSPADTCNGSPICLPGL